MPSPAPYHTFEDPPNVAESELTVVFDEAENRIHAQKSVLAWCFGAI